MVPPMILFWYQRLPSSVTSKLPKGWSAGTTEKGWMTAESFYEYLTNVFYPWLLIEKIQFPIILYLDGHSSHVTMPTVQFCIDHQIELISLYPNATHIMQPLDVSLFRPMKIEWKRTMNEWRIHNAPEKLKREDFAEVMKTAIDRMNFLSTIKNGFEKCGLFPFSKDAINYDLISTENKVSEDKPEEEHVSSVCKDHLIHLESFIDENVLLEFKKATSDGTGIISTENLGLFKIWLKMSTFSGILYFIYYFIINY